MGGLLWELAQRASRAHHELCGSLMRAGAKVQRAAALDRDIVHVLLEVDA
jgi:hypothetical protein